MALSHNPSIVTSGLQLYVDAPNKKSYPGSGTTWYDISNSKTNSTLINGPVFSSGNPSYISFDGIDDYASVNTALTNNSDFSVNFWIYYVSALGTDKGILTTWDTSWNGFGIGTNLISGTHYIRSWCNNGAGGGMNWDALNSIRNTWAMLTLTYNFSSKTQYGYINANFKISETFGSGVTHSTLQISRGGATGSTQLSYYTYANAYFSNISVYNRLLSATEITQNFNALRGRFGI